MRLYVPAAHAAAARAMQVQAHYDALDAEEHSAAPPRPSPPEQQHKAPVLALRSRGSKDRPDLRIQVRADRRRKVSNSSLSFASASKMFTTSVDGAVGGITAMAARNFHGATASVMETAKGLPEAASSTLATATKTVSDTASSVMETAKGFKDTLSSTAGAVTSEVAGKLSLLRSTADRQRQNLGRRMLPMRVA
jgi:hypothetical protein